MTAKKAAGKRSTGATSAKSKTGAKKAGSRSKKAATAPDMEALLREFGAMLESTGQAPLGETQVLLKSMRHMNDFGSSTTEAHDIAQDLCFEAMEARTAPKALALYRKALKVDPDCVDATAGIAQLTARTDAEEIEALERAVAAGERAFGPKYFAQNAGDFWGLIETRPYMRARHRLAALLLDVGRLDDAIAHMNALLELNPEDNQGARNLLLAALLQPPDLPAVRRLMKRYKEDGSLTFAWARVLECLLAESFDEAEKAFALARQQNPFLELYLTGQRKRPDRTPDFYSFGSAEEAILCLDVMDEAWAANPEALRWLVARLVRGLADPIVPEEHVSAPGPSRF